MDASSNDSEIDPIVTIKTTIESSESISKNVKFKETHKVKHAELVFDLILPSNRLTSGDESQFINNDNKPLDGQVSYLLYKKQQPT